jgi:hypothetical protein
LPVDLCWVTDTIVPQVAPPSRGGSRRPSRGVMAGVAVVAVLGLAVVGYEVTKGGDSNSAPPSAPVAQGSGTPHAGTVPPATPQALLRAATADALSSGAVRLRIRNSSHRAHLTTVSSVAMTTSGTQQIKESGGTVADEVFGRATFASGDKRGLTRMYGFSPGMAARIVGHWVRIFPRQPGYHAITEGVTLPSVMHEVKMVHLHPRLLHAVKDGVSVVGVAGRPTGPGMSAKATGVMWVSVGPTPLPVEFEQTDPAGVRSVVRFSRWGDIVKLSPPSTYLTLKYRSGGERV